MGIGMDEEGYVLDTVRHDEIMDTEDGVVGENLIEDSLGDGNIRRLIFENHQGGLILSIENGITTEAFLPYPQLNFISEKGGRITEVMNKIIDEMLAYPLLRR